MVATCETSEQRRSTVQAVKRMRRIELGLEQVLDGLAGRVFRGPLHPKELVGRIERAADMASKETEIGVKTANVYRVGLNPVDLKGDVAPLQIELSAALERSALERGWRLDGPARVMIVTSPNVPAGTAKCTYDSIPGPRPAWGTLVGALTIPITVNRAVVGRSADADVVVEDDTVSRRHALLWTESGSAHVRDLRSTNGTRVDGEPAASTVIEPGSLISFGNVSFRFEAAV